MFAVQKNRYTCSLIGIFVFLFISVVTFDAHASVCFLPTGCGEDDVTIVGEDNPSWADCYKTQSECEKNNVGAECVNTNDEYCPKYPDPEPEPDNSEPTCNTSCFADKHKTCKAVSEDCYDVDRDCGSLYVSKDYCLSDGNEACDDTDGDGCWSASVGSVICPDSVTNAYDNLATCENRSAQTTCEVYSEAYPLCYKEVDCTSSNETCEKCVKGTCENNCPVGYTLNCSATTSTKCTSHSQLTSCKVEECKTESGWLNECPAGRTCDESNECYKVSGCATGYEASCPTGKVCTETNGCYQVGSCDTANGYYDTCPDGKTCEEVNGCQHVTGVAEGECPADKICIKFNYTYEGKKLTEKILNKILARGGDSAALYTEVDFNLYNCKGWDENNECYPYERIGEICSKENAEKIVYKTDSSTINADDEYDSDYLYMTWDNKELLGDNNMLMIDKSLMPSDNQELLIGMISYGDDFSFEITANTSFDYMSIKNIDGNLSAEVAVYYSGSYTYSNLNIDEVIEMNVDFYEKGSCSTSTRDVSIIATCNKITEMDCDEIGDSYTSAYMLETGKGCFKVNEEGCINPILKYRDGDILEKKSVPTINQIYKVEETNEEIILKEGNSGYTTPEGEDVYVGSDYTITPTDKFMYTFSDVPACGAYTAEITPLKERVYNDTGEGTASYLLFREFVFEDLRESHEVRINGYASNYLDEEGNPKNIIITLNEDENRDGNNDLMLYPVIDYEYRAFAFIDFDRVANSTDYGMAQKIVYAITVNNPFINKYHESPSVTNSHPYMSVEDAGCSYSQSTTFYACGICHENMGYVSLQAGDAMNVAKVYQYLRDNDGVFSWGNDSHHEDGVYVNNAYYSGSENSPYSGGNCWGTYYYISSNFADDSIRLAGDDYRDSAYGNGMKKLVSFDSDTTEWNIWGHFYPAVSLADYVFAEHPITGGYYGVTHLSLHCNGSSASNYLDSTGIYHRYNGFSCEEMK